MKELQRGFDKWLDGVLESFNLETAAFCFNIYENAGDENYSVELTAFDKYDEYDADWNAGGAETYASRNDDNEYYFSLDAEWEECLKLIQTFIADYLEEGKYAEKLKKAEVVAYGFVDGDCDILYQKD
ncbi:MAG: hypothetical protein LBQ40_02835 [Clostridiales bacterium]|jgi:hypothetical protein|nr:hypothetical protein [Clostridiales bacterium]